MQGCCFACRRRCQILRSYLMFDACELCVLVLRHCCSWLNTKSYTQILTHILAIKKLFSSHCSRKLNRELKQQRQRRLQKRHLKGTVFAASNFIALIPCRSVRQMLAIFSGIEFFKTVSRIRKRKRKSVYAFHKT